MVLEKLMLSHTSWELHYPLSLYQFITYALPSEHKFTVTSVTSFVMVYFVHAWLIGGVFS